MRLDLPNHRAERARRPARLQGHDPVASFDEADLATARDHERRRAALEDGLDGRSDVVHWRRCSLGLWVPRRRACWMVPGRCIERGLEVGYQVRRGFEADG